MPSVKPKSFQFNQLASAIKKQTLICSGALPLISVGLLSPMAYGEASLALEEVIVTARKRMENVQDVPMSVNALDSQELKDLNISSFEDYAQLIPNLSYTSKAPGQAQIFMRGVSDGGDGNASGSSPSVAVYLDEQPVTVIGRNLDVHIYDIQQVEVMAGPQGTLFGASSQAGTLRIITNKPNVGLFDADISIGLSSTHEGEMSHKVEGYVNIPVGDVTAIRLVGWQEHKGGYIDAVAATKTFSRSGITINNDGFVEDDYNEVDNYGIRAALTREFNDEWQVTLTDLYQKQETNGVWDHSPDNVGDLEVARFNKDEGVDEFNQFSITLEGSTDNYEFVYAGSWLDRDITYFNDYTEYAEYSGYVDYYTCLYDATTFAVDFTTCEDPRILLDKESHYKRLTQELRFQYLGSDNYSYVVGIFYEDAEHDYNNQYRIANIKPGMEIRGIDTYFVTDQVRTEEQISLFGEFTYDFNDSWTMTVGGRHFENESEIVGFVGTVFSGSPDVDVNTDDSGETYKVNLSYSFDYDHMIYATYSEGYRSGGVNRVGTPNIPIVYKPDLIENYEFGWKTTWQGGRLRVNGAIFHMDWQDIQFTRFDPSESFLGLTSNAGLAEVDGIEIDVAYQLTQNWEVSFNGAYNDAVLAEDYVRKEANGATPAEILPSGTELPFVPKSKFNVMSRYWFQAYGADAYVQGIYAHTADSFNDLVVTTRKTQDSYNTLNLSIGFETNEWGAEFYVSNLTDERAELFRNTTDFDERVTINRPRTIGIRFSKRFE